MTIAKISTNVDTLDIDGDGKSDHITFQVTQTAEQNFLIRTLIDTSKDGFGTLNSDKTKSFKIDVRQGWQLSQVKFENNKLILLGQDGSPKNISLENLITTQTPEENHKLLIDSVIKRNMAQIRYPYQRELQAHPDLTGTVTVRFVIGSDGFVTSAEVKTGKNPENGKEYTQWNDPSTGAAVNKDLCQAFMKFQFPEPKGGEPTVSNYPFNFAPG